MWWAVRQHHFAESRTGCASSNRETSLEVRDKQDHAAGGLGNQRLVRRPLKLRRGKRRQYAGHVADFFGAPWYRFEDVKIDSALLQPMLKAGCNTYCHPGIRIESPGIHKRSDLPKSGHFPRDPAPCCSRNFLHQWMGLLMVAAQRALAATLPELPVDVEKGRMRVARSGGSPLRCKVRGRPHLLGPKPARMCSR